MSYELLDLEQGTDEWLAVRLKYVTASQIPIVMGISPYQTREQLLLEKLHGTKEEISEDKKELFEKGHSIERALRTLLNRKGSCFEPHVLLSSGSTKILASLDGFSRESKIILECKYVGKRNLQIINTVGLSEMHMFQVQAQLKVSEARHCLYIASDSERIVEVEVLPDLAMQGMIMKEVELFYKDLEELRDEKK